MQLVVWTLLFFLFYDTSSSKWSKLYCVSSIKRGTCICYQCHHLNNKSSTQCIFLYLALNATHVGRCKAAEGGDCTTPTIESSLKFYTIWSPLHWSLLSARATLYFRPHSSFIMALPLITWLTSKIEWPCTHKRC